MHWSNICSRSVQHSLPSPRGAPILSHSEEQQVGAENFPLNVSDLSVVVINTDYDDDNDKNNDDDNNDNDDNNDSDDNNDNDDDYDDNNDDILHSVRTGENLPGTDGVSSVEALEVILHLLIGLGPGVSNGGLHGCEELTHCHVVGTAPVLSLALAEVSVATLDLFENGQFFPSRLQRAQTLIQLLVVVQAGELQVGLHVLQCPDSLRVFFLQLIGHVLASLFK